MDPSGTVHKALLALDTIYKMGGRSSLSELAKAMGMPKPTLHRLLASLARFDLIERDSRGRYALGIGLVRLGLGAQKADPFVRLARSWLERAAHEFNETFFAVGDRAGRLFVLDRVEGNGVLRAAPNVGEQVPLDNTACGRLYLALAPEQVATDPSGKRADAEAVRRAKKRGYDINQGEWLTGVTVVAAPVFVQELLGCIACAGASVHLTGERLKEAVSRTRALAREIEHAWDYSAKEESI